MDLFRRLEKIRQKPVRERKKIMAFWIIVIMALIVGAWLSIGPFSLPKKAGSKDKTPPPWTILKNTITDQYKNIKENYNKNGINNEVYQK